jgi:hypothetical protein
MIVAQQKFLSEIFAEPPKFCPEPHRGSEQPRTELCSGTGLHFEFWIFVSVSNLCNSKLFKILLRRRIPSGGGQACLPPACPVCRQAGGRQGRQAPSEEKVKIGHRPEASGRCPEASGRCPKYWLTKEWNKAISIVPSRHCEEWSDEAISLNELRIKNYEL